MLVRSGHAAAKSPKPNTKTINPNFAAKFILISCYLYWNKTGRVVYAKDSVLFEKFARNY